MHEPSLPVIARRNDEAIYVGRSVSLCRSGLLRFARNDGKTEQENRTLRRDCKKKSAIIFDFDYTLADSSKGVVQCINYAFDSMGEPSRSWDECCATIGLSLPDAYESLTGDKAPEKVAAFRRLFAEKADQVMTPNTELYPGVSDLVRRLASQGLVLGIVSTKFRYRIGQILDRHGLTGHFDVIVGGEDVENHKPDPEGLQLFLSKASMTAGQVVFAGDSLTDAETALRGGVDFVAILTGTTSADQFAAYTPKALLDSVTDIETYVKTGTIDADRPPG